MKTRVPNLICYMFVAAGLLLSWHQAIADQPQTRRVPPILVNPAPYDRDGNRILDSLDQELLVREPGDPVQVIVRFDSPVSEEQINQFAALGGQIRQLYRHVAYGFAGTLPAGNVAPLASTLGESLSYVRLAQDGLQSLDFSVEQVRVRDGDPSDSDSAFVWSYGYTGDPNSSVAIAGSGITVTHNDLGDSPDDDVVGDPDDWGDPNDPTNVIVGWYDPSPNQFANPRDINEHETLVAGIVAGRGSVDPSFIGVAPDTRLVGLKFGWDDSGTHYFYDSDFVAAVDWLLAGDAFVRNEDYLDHIDVQPSVDDPNNDPNRPDCYYGLRAVPTLGDLDGDGDLDMLVGTADGRVHGVLNSGNATNPLWRHDHTFSGGLPSVNPYAAPALGDIDGDGDLDLMIGQDNDGNGDIFAWKNTGSTGSPAWSIETLWSVFLADSGDRPAPTLGDLDGDGDLDLVVGLANGDIDAYEFTGTLFNWAPAFVSGVSTGGANAQPALADLDGDSDLDLAIGLQDGSIIAFRNTGNVSSPSWTQDDSLVDGVVPVSGGGYAAPALADLDDDGDQDLLAGKADGYLTGYRKDSGGTLNRDRFGIKVLNLSTNWADNGCFDLIGALDTLVANGIVVTCSAGNGHDNGPSNDYYYVTYPARSPRVITVGSTTTRYNDTWDRDIIAGYSSNGDPNDPIIKPDVVAPGGGYYLQGGTIRGTDVTPADAYRNDWGTSFAAPHVAGLAALIIEAQEDNGDSWQYTEEEVMEVKAILQMTATETVLAGEDPGSDPQDPNVDRGGKDRVEGYGRINGDAAIEAATMTWDGSSEQAALGDGPRDKKCWARKVTLTQSNDPHVIALQVPSGADFDLYLYEIDPAANGEPVIAYSSTTDETADPDNDEELSVSTTDQDETYYVVVKWVEGSGSFNLTLEQAQPECCDLVFNGDFSEGLTAWTVTTGSNPGHPEPQITVEDVPPMENALHIFRPLDYDGSHAMVLQDPDNGEVPPGSQVTLSFDVRIESHNFGGYNSWNVYPANVWIHYTDELGDPGVIRRSFYNLVSEGHTPDPEPLAEQIELAVWVHRTYDLSDVSPAIAQITQIRAGSQGWSYDVAFDNLSLLVQQPPPCLGDLDGDSDVDLADLAQLLANYGVTSGASYEDGDLDLDGDVDLSDLALLLSVYGTACG